ncbi:MAG: protein translocase subunit SecF [candidate division Zixibacteria bacterium]|nr:protein translocase subunit SecF [candidate division Zixibacteria bacterium]
MFKIIGKTNFDFIGLRKFSFILSTILIVLGLIALVNIMIGNANMGIDFTGGTMIQGNFEKPINIEDLRSTLAAGGFPEANIQALQTKGVPNSFLIRAKTLSDHTTPGAETTNDKIIALIAGESKFSKNPFHKDSEQMIGALVGEELRTDARNAVLLAIVGILVYIWIRFDLRFGVAATVATFHDVLTVLGIFWVLDIEINQLVITALLTLGGYSLTDSVVVFDRIRENLKLFRKKGDFVATLNASINEVLSRTIITSMTSLLVVVVILLFGGQVLFTFALALTLGIIVGTYSSVFVASPIVAEWEARYPKRFK